MNKKQPKSDKKIDKGIDIKTQQTEGKTPAGNRYNWDAIRTDYMESAFIILQQWVDRWIDKKKQEGESIPSRDTIVKKACVEKWIDTKKAYITEQFEDLAKRGINKNLKELGSKLCQRVDGQLQIEEAILTAIYNQIADGNAGIKINLADVLSRTGGHLGFSTKEEEIMAPQLNVQQNTAEIGIGAYRRELAEKKEVEVEAEIVEAEKIEELIEEKMDKDELEFLDKDE